MLGAARRSEPAKRALPRGDPGFVRCGRRRATRDTSFAEGRAWGPAVAKALGRARHMTHVAYALPSGIVAGGCGKLWRAEPRSAAWAPACALTRPALRRAGRAERPGAAAGARASRAHRAQGATYKHTDGREEQGGRGERRDGGSLRRHEGPWGAAGECARLDALPIVAVRCARPASFPV